MSGEQVNIIEHRKALARALIQTMRHQSRAIVQLDDVALAFLPNDDVLSIEQDLHAKGCTLCVATKLFFVDSLSEKIVTSSNYGDLWMGLWLDCPVYLHDGENEPSSNKTTEQHGNTLFPRWLAEVLNEEGTELGIKEEDIYDGDSK